MSEREASITLDGNISPVFKIYCGLPQGSPASPILFLLAIEGMLHLSPKRFGYADDVAFIASAPTLARCGELLQTQLFTILAWGRKNGIVLEVSKTELQYFHRKHGSPLEPSVYANGVEIRPNAHTCWCEVIFDQSLRFRENVRQACGRSLAITSHIKSLSGVTRGMSHLLLRQALQGAAFATLLYGAETWYSKGTPKRLVH